MFLYSSCVCVLRFQQEGFEGKHYNNWLKLCIGAATPPVACTRATCPLMGCLHSTVIQMLLSLVSDEPVNQGQ